MKRSSLLLPGRVALIAVLALSSVLAYAADKKGSKDHPLVSRFAGSSIYDYNSKKFDETEIATGLPYTGDQPGKLWEKSVHVEGRITRILYMTPVDTTTLEVARSYRDALTGAGFSMLFECAKEQCGTDGTFSPFARAYRAGHPFTDANTYAGTSEQRYLAAVLKRPAGDVYVDLFVLHNTSSGDTATADHTMVAVEVVESKPMATGEVTVDADAIARALAGAGRITMDNIYFDTGKSSLQAASGGALDEIAKALKAHPELKIEIDGHTDNVGDSRSNQLLSQQRAESVRAALVTRGVDISHLGAKGFGDSKPVASNADEAGRAHNRRVELVRQ
ncbi:MAG: DUF4892 domain-containing protein [Rhodanobacter sp.]